MNCEFSWQIFKKYSNIKFHENPSSGSLIVACEQMEGKWTDMMKLIVTFHNFVNVPKYRQNLSGWWHVNGSFEVHCRVAAWCRQQAPKILQFLKIMAQYSTSLAGTTFHNSGSSFGYWQLTEMVNKFSAAVKVIVHYHFHKTPFF
jgi:hypothetical protein